jgi:hypothetical protein
MADVRVSGGNGSATAKTTGGTHPPSVTEAKRQCYPARSQWDLFLRACLGLIPRTQSGGFVCTHDT